MHTDWLSRTLVLLLFGLTLALGFALQHNRKEGEKKPTGEQKPLISSHSLNLALLSHSVSLNLILQHKLKQGKEDSPRLVGS